MMNYKALLVNMPHVVSGLNMIRMARSSLNDGDVRDGIHAHLTGLGFKRNVVLSDAHEAVYSDGNQQVFVTHYKRETVLEMGTAIPNSKRPSSSEKSEG